MTPVCSTTCCPLWEARYPGIDVQIISVGSGQALAAAAAGNCDVIIVHAPPDEKALLASGDLTMRLPIAYNYFTVVGPWNTTLKRDPAGVSATNSAVAAFKKIAAWGAKTGKVAFVSARRQFRHATRRSWRSGRRPASRSTPRILPPGTS